jgi:uncharacterized membrane protein
MAMPAPRDLYPLSQTQYKLPRRWQWIVVGFIAVIVILPLILLALCGHAHAETLSMRGGNYGLGEEAVMTL